MTRFLSSLALAVALTVAPGALHLSAASANGDTAAQEDTSRGGATTQRACSNCW